MAMTVSHCESSTCCTHPDESQRALNRDGVLTIVCVECNTEIGPADIESCQPTQNPAAPCGDDVPPSEECTQTSDAPTLRRKCGCYGIANRVCDVCQNVGQTAQCSAVSFSAQPPCGSDIPHRWGSPL